MKRIETSNAPAAIGPYSQGFVSGGMVFTSGQIPMDPATGLPAGDSIEQQARQSCKNVAAVLEAGGSSLKKVVKTTCFLADMADFPAFNRVYEEFFTEKPARSCVAPTGTHVAGVSLKRAAWSAVSSTAWIPADAGASAPAPTSAPREPDEPSPAERG